MIQQRGTLWLAVFSTALLLPSSAAAQTPISPARPGVQYMRGAARNAAASASPAAGAANNLQNISSQQMDSPPDAFSGVNGFLSGLDGSEYLSLSGEYMFGGASVLASTDLGQCARRILRLIVGPVTGFLSVAALVSASVTGKFDSHAAVILGSRLQQVKATNERREIQPCEWEK